MRLDGDAEPEAMTDNLHVDIVRIILGKISDMCVRPFRMSTPLVMFTYQGFRLDSSMFRSTSTTL